MNDVSVKYVKADHPHSVQGIPRIRWNEHERGAGAGVSRRDRRRWDPSISWGTRETTVSFLKPSSAQSPELHRVPQRGMGDSQGYNDQGTRIAGCFKGSRGVLDFKAEIEHSELRCRIQTMCSGLASEMLHQRLRGSRTMGPRPCMQSRYI